MKTLVVLGGSALYYSSFLSLKKTGDYNLILIDRNPDAFCKAIVDDFICADFSDVKILSEVLARIDFDGIIPLNDIGVLAIAQIGNKFPGLKTLGIEVALNCSHKYLMREKWGLIAEINCPRVHVCKSLDEAKPHFWSLNGKAIVKPYTGESGGSRGVKVAQSLSELDDAIKECQHASRSDLVLVEEFLQCTSEHSVEVLVENSNIHILGVGDNNKAGLPYRVNSSIDYPSSLGPEEIALIQSQLNLCIPALGLKNSVVHAEFGRVEDKFYIFELGARSGGGGIPFIINEIYRNNEIVFAAQVSTGDLPFIKNIRLNPVQVARYHFFMFGQGVVKGINGLTWLKKQDWVKFPHIFVQVGDEIRAVVDGSARQGACIVIASDKIDLDYKLAQLNENFSVEFW